MGFSKHASEGFIATVLAARSEGPVFHIDPGTSGRLECLTLGYMVPHAAVIEGTNVNQTTITTLEERKSAEAARRKGAADQVVAELRDYARRNAGRFIVFGSYASSQMRFDSDLDLLIDFPQSGIAEAWQFAEEVCARHAIPLDVHDANTTKLEFLNRVRVSGVFLP